MQLNVDISFLKTMLEREKNGCKILDAACQQFEIQERWSTEKTG